MSENSVLEAWLFSPSGQRSYEKVCLFTLQCCLFVFLSLEIPPHCYEVNLVAVAYDAHFTGMYGVAGETAFMLFKDQLSLKIEVVFWEKE